MILYEMLVGYPPFASETPQVPTINCPAVFLSCFSLRICYEIQLTNTTIKMSNTSWRNRAIYYTITINMIKIQRALIDILTKEKIRIEIILHQETYAKILKWRTSLEFPPEIPISEAGKVKSISPW